MRLFLVLVVIVFASPTWAETVKNCWEKPYFSWTFEVKENKNLISDLSALDNLRKKSAFIEWTMVGDGEIDRSFYARPKLPVGLQDRAKLTLTDIEKALILFELQLYVNQGGNQAEAVRVECQVNPWRETVPNYHNYANDPKESDEKVAEALLNGVVGKETNEYVAAILFAALTKTEMDENVKTTRFNGYPIIFLWRPSLQDPEWKLGAVCGIPNECFHETGHVAMAWVNPDSKKVDYLSFWKGRHDPNHSNSGSPGKLNSFLEDLQVMGTYPHVLIPAKIHNGGQIIEGRLATSWNFREMSKQLEQWKEAPPRFNIKNQRTFDCVRSVENFMQQGAVFEGPGFPSPCANSFYYGVQQLISLVMPSPPDDLMQDTFYNEESDVYLHPALAIPLGCWMTAKGGLHAVGIVASIPVGIGVGVAETIIPGFRERFVKCSNFISNLTQMGRKTPNYFESLMPFDQVQVPGEEDELTGAKPRPTVNQDGVKSSP